jgi:hypothetical protein
LQLQSHKPAQAVSQGHRRAAARSFNTQQEFSIQKRLSAPPGD